MSPKKTILRELDLHHRRQGADQYISPGALAGFDRNDPRHRAALNQLLHQRLIRGTTGPDGAMVIALSPQRLGDVRRMVRPWQLRPAVWAAALGTVGVAATLIALL